MRLAEEHKRRGKNVRAGKLHTLIAFFMRWCNPEIRGGQHYLRTPDPRAEDGVTGTQRIAIWTKR